MFELFFRRWFLNFIPVWFSFRLTVKIMLQPPSLLCWLLYCDSLWAVPLQQQEQAAPLAAAQDTTRPQAAHVEWGPPQGAYITIPDPEVPVRANLLIRDVSDPKAVPSSVASLIDGHASIPILDYASAPVPSPINFPAFIPYLLQDVAAPAPSPRNVPASVPSLQDVYAPAPSPRNVPYPIPTLQDVAAPAPSPRNVPAFISTLQDVPASNSRSVPASMPSLPDISAPVPSPRNVPASVPSLEDAPATVTSHKDAPSDTEIDLVVASRPVGDESQTPIVRPVTVQETNLTVQQTTNASTPTVKWGQDRMLGLLAAQLSTVPVPVPGKVTPTLFLWMPIRYTLLDVSLKIFLPDSYDVNNLSRVLNPTSCYDTVGTFNQRLFLKHYFLILGFKL
jgi:hypothetical protein